MSLNEPALQKLYQKAVRGEDLEKNDYIALICSFAPGNAGTSSLKGQGFVALSTICDRCRQSTTPTSDSDDDDGTLAIVGLFYGIIEEKMASVLELPIVEAITFVIALFTVDWKAGSAIFVRDGFQDSLLDALDLFPSSNDLSYAVASLFAIACGYKNCRCALNPRCSIWLKSCILRKKDNRLMAASSLALLKLSQGLLADGNSIGAGVSASQGRASGEDEAFQALRDTVIESKVPIADAIEGVAYLSAKARFKELIIKDSILLKRLASFEPFLLQSAPNPAELGSTPFGLVAVIANLCTYRPRLSEEQTQIEKLKRMASARGTEESLESRTDLDDDEHVRLRGKRIVALGMIDLLLTIGRSTKSPSTRSLVGKAALGLVEDKENRGRFLQAGGAKVLLSLITSTRLTFNTNDDDTGFSKDEYTDLAPIQALAKLSITSSPLQVFGPNENAGLDAIRPLGFMLICPTSNLLQKFEAMMSLTNLSSVGPTLATRIADSKGIMEKIEFNLLEEHQLIRRAACELVCNLVSNSEKAFGLFSGEAEESGTIVAKRAKSRLQILVALTDVDDSPTRLAASGALAVLTASPKACKYLYSLENEHNRAFSVLKQLLDPVNEDGEATDLGLLHRGTVCFRNILINSDEGSRREVAREAARRGLVEAFVKIIKAAGQSTVPDAALRPAAEALKFLSDSGVEIKPRE